MLAGEVDHGDSLGNSGTLGAGDVQWMTAGSGIMHQEMPQGDAQGRMHGFQLWANLPRVAEDDGAALPGHQGRRRSRRSSTTTAPRARRLRRFLGQEGPGRRRRRRSALSRHLGAARQAQDLQGRGRPARLRLRLRGLRHVRLGLRAVRRADREGGRRPGDHAPRADRQPLAGPVRPRRRGHGAGRRGGHPLPAGVRQADRGAGRLVRADRDEHAGRAEPGGVASCATARSSRSSDGDTQRQRDSPLRHCRATASHHFR